MPHSGREDVPFLTVVETGIFARRAAKLLDVEEHGEMIFYLATHPFEGNETPGTGGIRKLRYAAHGRGKSGGVRVIYYFFDLRNPLYALLLYGKNEQVDLTGEQKRELTKLAEEIKGAARKRRTP